MSPQRSKVSVYTPTPDNRNGDFLLVSGTDSLDILNATTGEVVRSFPSPFGEWPWRFAWRPDGNRLAVGTKDGIIQIWGTSNLGGLPSTPTFTVPEATTAALNGDE
jgi:WD40 repeat protein